LFFDVAGNFLFWYVGRAYTLGVHVSSFVIVLGHCFGRLVEANVC
jgi:hypothetical protein